MGGDDDERSFHFGKRPDKTYVSKGFQAPLSGRTLRYASRVLDSPEGQQFAVAGDELVIRATPKSRTEIKAVFTEDSRKITTLTIQRFNPASGPSARDYFSFIGSEIDALLTFILGVRTISLGDSKKVHLSDDQLRDLILNDGQARQIFAENEDLFIRIAQSEDLKRDLVAVGYRRKQLDRFERLLRDEPFFDAERQRLGAKPEGVWQAFFEANTWIFGYGLSYQFLSALDDRKLEQVVRGSDVGGSGKRVDALMKTQARINSLCFVEIKRHDTRLLAQTAYRPDSWPPSADLSGGVAQVQATVQAALENLDRKVAITDRVGDPTGETLFNIQPRSFLVIGNLDEFVTDNGVNESKFRSFEMYRRHTRQPDIITFDELLHRARFIVEHGEARSVDKATPPGFRCS